MTAIIYKITNTLNGKAYIGFTRESINRRWTKHCSEAKNKSSRYICRAIRKYGTSKFEHQILYEGENSQWILNVVEPFFIALYNTTNPSVGYNLTKGGDGIIGYTLTEKARRKMSKCKLGIPLSKTHKENISKSLVGKKHSTEAKKKMSESAIGKIISKETRNKISNSLKGKKSPKWKGYWKTPLDVFESTRSAASFFQISPSTVRHRCKNPNPKFSDWNFIPNQ